MSDGNSNRQFQGFSYPTAPPTTRAGPPSSPPAGGGVPFYSAGGAHTAATGLVRRTAGSTSGAAGPLTSAPTGGLSSPAGGGYGYFHRATSSGSHSAFAAGSDAGSSHGQQRTAYRSLGPAAVVPTTPPSLMAGSTTGQGLVYPQAVSTQGLAAHRPSSVQLRGDGTASVDSAAAGAQGGAMAYPFTPTIAVDTRNSSGSSSAINRNPLYAGGSSSGVAGPPWGVNSGYDPRQPPPHASSTAISFLPPSSSTTADAALLLDTDSAAVNMSGSGGGRGVGGIIAAGNSAGRPSAAAPYMPSPLPYLPSSSTLVGDDSAKRQQQQQQSNYSHFDPSRPSPPAATGFFKDMMNRLLSDLDESGNPTSAGDGGNGGAGRGVEARPLHQTRFGCPEDDLPLLEELGIFPSHIWRKARAVLHPFRQMPIESVEDTDLAGPLLFAVALAVLLSLQGKIQFSAIYGLSVLGVILFKAMLTLMHTPGGSSTPGAPLQFIISSLGYALLPSLVLALLRTVQFWVAGSYSTFLLPLAFVVIVWSSWCATSLIVRGLNMEPQRYLILYPMVLFYALFAALTIF